uniref:LssY C-terminal domain-containing protein n=1 Tax=Rhodoblastus sp. TaxID=1962975 RepID=UPI0035B08033
DTRRPSEDECVLWIGAGTKDTGFSLTRLSFQITHATDADTNEERDVIIEQLQRCCVIANVRSYRPSERLATGRVNRYVTDGIVAVAELTPPAG